MKLALQAYYLSLGIPLSTYLPSSFFISSGLAEENADRYAIVTFMKH